MYQILLSPRAQKSIRNLDKSQRERVIAAINLLAQNPFPKGKKVKKLVGVTGGWRLRVGNLRVLYIIEEKTIKIYTVEKRGDVY